MTQPKPEAAQNSPTNSPDPVDSRPVTPSQSSENKTDQKGFGPLSRRGFMRVIAALAGGAGLSVAVGAAATANKGYLEQSGGVDTSQPAKPEQLSLAEQEKKLTDLWDKYYEARRQLVNHPSESLIRLRDVYYSFKLLLNEMVKQGSEHAILPHSKLILILGKGYKHALPDGTYGEYMSIHSDPQGPLTYFESISVDEKDVFRPFDQHAKELASGVLSTAPDMSSVRYQEYDKQDFKEKIPYEQLDELIKILRAGNLKIMPDFQHTYQLTNQWADSLQSLTITSAHFYSTFDINQDQIRSEKQPDTQYKPNGNREPIPIIVENNTTVRISLDSAVKLGLSLTFDDNGTSKTIEGALTITSTVKEDNRQNRQPDVIPTLVGELTVEMSAGTAKVTLDDQDESVQAALREFLPKILAARKKEGDVVKP